MSCVRGSANFGVGLWIMHRSVVDLAGKRGLGRSAGDGEARISAGGGDRQKDWGDDDARFCGRVMDMGAGGEGNFGICEGDAVCTVASGDDGDFDDNVKHDDGGTVDVGDDCDDNDDGVMEMGAGGCPAVAGNTGDDDEGNVKDDNDGGGGNVDDDDGGDSVDADDGDDIDDEG